MATLAEKLGLGCEATKLVHFNEQIRAHTMIERTITFASKVLHPMHTVLMSHGWILKLANSLSLVLGEKLMKKLLVNNQRKQGNGS